jgi:hypothetical protein
MAGNAGYPLEVVNGGQEADAAAQQEVRWWRFFPGEEQQIGELRGWLALILPDCPARADVIVVACELGTNALRHTASGQDGVFGVDVSWHPPVVRVGVADCGAAAEPRVVDDPGAEDGRGLLLVRGLSERTWVTGDQSGRVVWAEISWDGAEPETGVALPDTGGSAGRGCTEACRRRTWRSALAGQAQ